MAERKGDYEKAEKHRSELDGPELPKEAEYIVGAFYEVGPCGYGASGVVPLSFSELRSWSILTETDLKSWEASLLRTLSKIYCNVINGRGKAE